MGLVRYRNTHSMHTACRAIESLIKWSITVNKQYVLGVLLHLTRFNWAETLAYMQYKV